MRTVLTGLFAAAVGVALAMPAFAEEVYVAPPGATVGAGVEVVHPRRWDYDHDHDPNREVHQEYNIDDGNCHIHVEREYHPDGNYSIHRERECD